MELLVSTGQKIIRIVYKSLILVHENTYSCFPYVIISRLAACIYCFAKFGPEALDGKTKGQTYCLSVSDSSLVTLYHIPLMLMQTDAVHMIMRYYHSFASLIIIVVSKETVV